MRGIDEVETMQVVDRDLILLFGDESQTRRSRTGGVEVAWVLTGWLA